MAEAAVDSAGIIKVIEMHFNLIMALRSLRIQHPSQMMARCLVMPAPDWGQKRGQTKQKVEQN